MNWERDPYLVKGYKMNGKSVVVRFVLRQGATFGIVMNSEVARKLVEDWASYKMRGILRGSGGPFNHYAVNLDEVVIIDTADPDDQPQRPLGGQGNIAWSSGFGN